MPEFVEHPPCGRRVFQNQTLLGFCARREGHKGGCTHLVDDRLTHNIRWQEGDE